MHNAHDANGKLPPTVGKLNNAFGTVHFHLLPYLEQQNLYQRAEGAVWKNGVNGIAVHLFVDGQDASAPPDNKFKDWLATTNYAANWLVFKQGENSFAQITDGTSNTLMFTQRYQICDGTPSAWGYPGLYTWTPMFGYYSQAKFQSVPTQKDCDPTRPAVADGGRHRSGDVRWKRAFDWCGDQPADLVVGNRSQRRQCAGARISVIDVVGVGRLS